LCVSDRAPGRRSYQSGRRCSCRAAISVCASLSGQTPDAPGLSKLQGSRSPPGNLHCLDQVQEVSNSRASLNLYVQPDIGRLALTTSVVAEVQGTPHLSCLSSSPSYLRPAPHPHLFEFQAPRLGSWVRLACKSCRRMPQLPLCVTVLVQAGDAGWIVALPNRLKILTADQVRTTHSL